LNIVKDDLIAKVDELSSEQEILRDEIRSLHAMRNRLRLRTDELEAEVKMLREEIENARKAAKSEEEVTFSLFRLMDFPWLTFYSKTEAGGCSFVAAQTLHSS
jgi:predicted  nucleic acid-binding Zn-ribbon protein